ERSDEEDRIADQGRTVKIGRRKHAERIEIEFEAPVSALDDDVVVDAEIRIIEIFVFAADVNDATVVEPRAGSPRPAPAPEWPGARLPIGRMIRAARGAGPVVLQFQVVAGVCAGPIIAAGLLP